MNSTADIVIIGGGVHGCSLAFDVAAAKAGRHGRRPQNRPQLLPVAALVTREQASTSGLGTSVMLDTAVACQPPLPPELIRNLLEFWGHLFQTDYEPFRGVLSGEETGQNRDVIYVLKSAGKITGTCHLTMAESNPSIGGLGEVGTEPAFRGLGIAGQLCKQARDDFQAAGGQALFLGTSNPVAARVYDRLGWRQVAGSNVMVFVDGEGTLQEFLVDYFRGGAATTIVAGSAVDRVPMIPLIVAPHDWRLMDANTDIHSTRWVNQGSCMGLYPRYASLTRNGSGTWFAARTDQQRTVGLSTACLDGRGGCQVDGFVHADYSPDGSIVGSIVWERLLQASVSWAVDQGAHSCRAKILSADGNKLSCFRAIGFDRVCEDESIDRNGPQTMTIERKN